MAVFTKRIPASMRRAIVAAQVSVLLILATSSATAGLLQIDFTASSSGAGPDATGQFILDTDIPWTVNGGFVGDVIVSGWFEAGGVSGAAIVGSAFTSVVATDNDTFSVIDIIGDYGPSLFGLTLMNNDGWFPSDDPYDVLAPGLTLDDLDLFIPDTSATTSFFYFELSPFTTNFLELTSFSVSEVGEISEPHSLSLAMLGALLLVGFASVGARSRV